MNEEPRKRRRKTFPALPAPVLEGQVEAANPRDPEPVRCVAHNRHGERCFAYPIRGGTVCNKHGGSAPQVVRAAKLRAQLASDTVMGRLINIALNSPDERAAIVAAKEVLDIGDVAKANAVEQPWEQMVVNVMGDDADREMPEHLKARYAGYVERQGGTLPEATADHYPDD